jgi:ERCC4-type nuclease
LLKRFGSLAGLQRATPEEIGSTAGIGPELARTIHDALHTVVAPQLRVVPDRLETA